MRHACKSIVFIASQPCRGSMPREMRNGFVMSVGTWPIWLGVTGTVIAVAAMATFVTGAFFDSAIPTNHTALHEPMQQGLRGAFLLISVGALCRLRAPLSTQWRWAVVAALAMLACAVAGELTGALVRIGWITDFSVSLGAADSLEPRLFRLGAMAAYAVPTLLVLAAGEHKQDIVAEKNRLSARIAALLVRWEPLLFTIGVLTLPSILLAGAFIHKELTWLSPIGADTTVAACAAAAIRARLRGDGLAFSGWVLICISMAVGLLMGSYSFGGPLPAPNFIGDYNALPRTLLRDGHVLLLLIGFVGIALATIRTPDEGVS